MVTSQNGWPVITDERLLVTITASGRTFRVAAGTGDVWTTFLNDYAATVEPFDGGVFDDWSFAVRNVRGSTTAISNHSSGTAVDLNALDHVRGVKGTFSAKQLVALRALLKRYPMIRWGGDFTTIVDDMHFELKHRSTSLPLVQGFTYIAQEADDMYTDEDRKALKYATEQVQAVARELAEVKARVMGALNSENSTALNDNDGAFIVKTIREEVAKLKPVTPATVNIASKPS